MSRKERLESWDHGSSGSSGCCIHIPRVEFTETNSTGLIFWQNPISLSLTRYAKKHALNGLETLETVIDFVWNGN